jgi:GxxExxY protein
MQDEAITGIIIGCAYQVHKTLGFGFLESVYEKSLLIEFARQDIKAVAQQDLTVYYAGQSVGEFRVDVLVDDRIILEIKSVQQLAPAHELQLVNYLVATHHDMGLLINFGPTKVDVKRKYRTLAQLKQDIEDSRSK